VKTPAVIDTGSYCVMVGEIFFTTTLGDSFNRYYNIATVYFRRLLRATAFKELMSAYCQGYSQNSHRNLIKEQDLAYLYRRVLWKLI
jgi:hypothetical protein